MTVLYTTGMLAASSNVMVSGVATQRCSETSMLVVNDPLEHTMTRSPTRCFDTPGPTSVITPLHSQPRPLPIADGSATTPTEISTSYLLLCQLCITAVIKWFRGDMWIASFSP